MKAIVTLCIGADQLGTLTHPLMRDYAHKVGADFVVIAAPKLNLKYIHYEKYQVYELLDTYDRILFLDSDIIVTPNCPDLFEIVPQNQFGAFLVSKHSYFHDGAIRVIQEVLGDIGWKREYFNSGVMLVSKQHQEVFCLEGDLLVWDSEKRDFFDQTILNYTVQKMGVPIYDIGYKFNHTTD
ncbi:MAG: hypothetical protein H0X31_21985, partial [Nostocaceae cyanobacterium]|nr:hypothetical protein [Nostocaceae cyanobacterium]